MTNIVAISGSLRAASTNTALVRAATALAPEGVTMTLYEGLDALPHYSPERDGAHNGSGKSPEAVNDLRARLGAADGMLICTPEYAFGMPGSLKNALDWLVSSGELWRKPVAAWSASPGALGGEKAHAALLLTLTALESEIAAEASLIIPSVRTKMTKEGVLTDPALSQALRGSLGALAQAVKAHEACLMPSST